MVKGTTKLDLVKLALYILKRCWLVIICAAIGFGVMYLRTRDMPVRYTSFGTMYVYNVNPNYVNYGAVSSSDLYTAEKLVSTYIALIRRDAVIDKVAERLVEKYPEEFSGVSNGYIAGSLSMSADENASIMYIYSTTSNPKHCRMICEAVLDVAPNALNEIVGAGSTKALDYPTGDGVPSQASARRNRLMGALFGAVAGAAILAGIFLLNRRVSDTKDLTDNYTPPVLASIKRDKRESDDPSAFLLNSKSKMEIIENYSKLRMNLLYTLVDKKNHCVVVTSAISGEGKSTITANLALSCAMSGKSVLLIDADMRRACQRDIFHYKRKARGLSNVLIGECKWEDAVIQSKQNENLDILPAGILPPNPAELLDSREMHELLEQLEKSYDIVLLDAPPINIVSDPLALSDQTAGSLFVVRQNFTDHREIRKALSAAELTGMKMLGFVFYGENLNQGSYYYRRYYKGYYHKYEYRPQAGDSKNTDDEASRRANSNENDR